MFKNDQRGIAHLVLIALTALGLIAFLFITYSAPFKNQFLSLLYPKPKSHAAISDPVVKQATLALTPSSQTLNKGCSYQLGVELDTAGDLTDGTDVILLFDSTVFSINSVGNTRMYYDYPDRSIQNGRVLISGISNPLKPIKGKGTFATINVSVKDDAPVSSSAINFDFDPSDKGKTTDTNVVSSQGEDAVDLLHSVTNGNFTISSGACPPAPTPEPTPTANLNLGFPPSTVYKVGTEFKVNLLVRTDTDRANLFLAKLDFDPSDLEVVRIENQGSFINVFVERFFDNSSGEVSIAGGVPDPGFITTGTDAFFASVVFRPKRAGITPLFINPSSQIYRNTDNAAILQMNSAPLELQIQPGEAASPTPTPTPPPAECVLTKAKWGYSSNPINSNMNVSLEVEATGGCGGKQVTFEVEEDDAALGSDPVKVNPSNVVLQFLPSQQLYKGSGTWKTEFQEDGLFGANNPPEYYFIAQLIGSDFGLTSEDPMLQVLKAAGTPEPLEGDTNEDGVVNFEDLSKMLSNWEKSQDFLDQLDLNGDGTVNTFDFSELVTILRGLGIIRGSES